MKAEIKRILKDKGKLDLYTDERADFVRLLMATMMLKDTWLKMYLSLDKLNRAQWCADHLVKLAESGEI